MILTQGGAQGSALCLKKDLQPLTSESDDRHLVSFSPIYQRDTGHLFDGRLSSSIPRIGVVFIYAMATNPCSGCMPCVCPFQ